MRLCVLTAFFIAYPRTSFEQIRTYLNKIRTYVQMSFNDLGTILGTIWVHNKKKACYGITQEARKVLLH